MGCGADLKIEHSKATLSKAKPTAGSSVIKGTAQLVVETEKNKFFLGCMVFLLF